MAVILLRTLPPGLCGRSHAIILGRKVEVNDATVRVQSKKSNHNLCTGLTGLPPGHQMNKQGKNKLIIPQNINIMVRSLFDKRLILRNNDVIDM